MNFSIIPNVYASVDATGKWGGECVGIGDAANVATITGIECLIQNLLTPLPAIIALAAVGMIILAGIRLTMAGANEKAYTAAWNTFTYAVVGLILLSVVWLVIILIKAYTGANITNFGI